MADTSWVDNAQWADVPAAAGKDWMASATWADAPALDASDSPMAAATARMGNFRGMQPTASPAAATPAPAPAPAPTQDQYQMPAIDDVPRLDAQGNAAPIPTRGDVASLQHDTAAMNYAAAESDKNAPAWLKNASFADDYRGQPAQAFDTKFGKGTAESYLGADLSQPADQSGPAMFSRDWWSQQLGATGDQPYGHGAGYLIDNPVTRGLAGFAWNTDAALAQLGARGADAIGLSDAQQFFKNQSAHDVAASDQLAAPKGSIGSAITQAGTKLGANLLMAAATGGAGADAQGAHIAGTGLMDAAKVAARSPAARMAATLGTTQASTEAAQLEAQGHDVSNAQLASMAALDTAANMVPLAGKGGIARRVATGAVVGEGINEGLNVANGRPLGSGAVMATATGAALGAFPGSHPMTLADEGRAVGAQVQFDNRMSLLRDSVARQDFEERMNQAAQQGGGFIHPNVASQLAKSVADEHGTSIDALLRAPPTPMDAGAVAADAALNEARQATASTTPDIPAAPAGAESIPALESNNAGLESATPQTVKPISPDLAPRAPALPEAPTNVTRDDLIQQWQAARTDGEKQSAAARIAAFDQQAQQAPASAPDVTLPKPYDWKTPLAAHSELNEPQRAALGARYRRAERTLPDFANALHETANGLGGEAIVAPLKDVPRAAAKVLKDYGGDASKIKDLLRGTIALSDHNNVDAAMNALRQRYGEPSKFISTLDPTAAPFDESGYRGVNSVWNVNGTPAEVQMNLPEMLAAKEKVHPLYAEREAIRRRLVEENRRPTNEENARIAELNRQMAAVYEPAWETAVARLKAAKAVGDNAARNSGSVRGTPSSKNTLAETNTGLSEDQSNATPPGGSHDQGAPSTSASRMPLGASGQNPIEGSNGTGDALSAIPVTSNGILPQNPAGKGEWATFPPDSGTLGIPRSEMPQIKGKDRDNFFRFLESRGIGNEEAEVPAASLKPTQAEFSPAMVDRFTQTGPIGKRRVLVSSDGYVLDGHHQALAHKRLGTDVPVIRLGAPIRELLDAAHAFPDVQRSPGADTAAGASNPIAELPVADLKLSDDVPQFKSGANDEGVVEPLGGAFDRRGTGPIQVWRRNDGRLEVISGRHRLDLARRSGEQTIPAQVYDESSGFDARQAASLDAELNIRDGQGKVADYVQYFQRPAFEGDQGRQAAESRGLLARATGRRAYTIARSGTPELLAAHRAGQLTDEAAVQIAHAAPGDEALQALGMKQVREGRSITSSINTMRALGSMRGDHATQGDIFGFDDSAIRDAEAMGKIAAAHQRELGEQVAAVQGAAKRPEKARALGVDVKDPEGIQRRIGELRTERDAWENWATDPDKVAQVRDEAGLKPLPEREPPSAEPEPSIDDRTGTMFSRDANDRATDDMFGTPTQRERVAAAERAKDAQRNGQAGGREDTGDGGLFDGQRPDQADLAGPRRSQEAEPAPAKFNATQVRDAAAKAWGNRFITKMERAGILHFIDTDEAVRLGLGTRDELRGVKGIYSDGNAYVLADQVKNLDAVPGIVVHEAGLHYGYDRLTTAEDRQALRNRVNRAVATGDADVIKAWRHAEKVGTPARALHEETMAYLVENHPGNGIAQRVIDAVKRGLNRAGVPMNLLESDSEAIRRTARDMLRRAATGEKPTRVRLDENGTQDWRASEIGGAPVFSRDVAHTPEFKRWFGDSKVVDAEGEPLVVYHGTGDDVTAFDKDKRGTAAGGRSSREGFFFSNLPEVGSQYADETPYFARDRVYKQMEAARIAGNSEKARALQNQFEYGDRSFGKNPNVMPVYLRMKRPKVVDFGGRGYNATHDNLTAAIREAKASGHDGVIFRNINDSIMRDTPPADHYIVFEPEQIKSAIGNRGTFDAGNPDIRLSRDLIGDDDTALGRARRDAAATRATVLNKLAAEGYPHGAVGWTGNPNSYEGFRGGAQRIVAGLADRYDPIKRMQIAITGGDANAVGDMANVYRLENLMHGRTGDRLARLDRDDVKPLIKSMRQLHVSSDLLNDYLLARHAPERNARIASINKEIPDGGSGITTEQAKAFMAGTAEGVYSGKKLTPALREKLEMLAKRVDRMRTETLDTLERSGQITPDLAAQLRKAYKHYVPLRGKASDVEGAAQPSSGGFGGRGIDIKGKPVRRALGRGESNLAPPHILGEIIGDAQRAIVQAEKARVGRALLRLALEHPNPDVWQVEPVELEWKFSESTGEAYLGTRKPTNDQDVLTVVHAGTPYHVRLVDPRLQEAVMNMDTRSAEFMVHWIGKMNRWLSAAFTRYNPAFMPINMTRDLLLGSVGMTAEHGIGQSAAALKYYLPAMRAAWRDFGGKHPGDASVPDAEKTMDDWAREYGEAGGKTGIAMADKPEVIAKNLASSVKTGLEILGETTLHPMTWGNPVQSVGRALGYLKPVVDVVERANDATENAMRLAAYVARRKGGASAEAAADYAKNLTVNFNRKGRWGPVLNSLFLFYNASLQGSRRIYQLMQDHPVGMAAFLGSLAALQAQQATVLMSRKGDDGISDWDAIPDYKKSTALIIALPGKGHYFALPMPYEFGFVTYAGGRMTQHVIEHDPSQKNDNLIGDLGTGFLHSFSPVPLEQGLTGLVPAPFQAFMDVRANKDDLGREITFGEDPNGYDKPQSSLGRPGVPAPYVWLSRELNKLGGGDPDWRPPPLAPSITDVSPDSLQYLANFFMGGLGSFVSGSWRTTESSLAGIYTDKKDGQTAVDWTKLASEMPILSRFGIQTNTNRARSDRFYDIRDEMDRTKAMIQDKVDHGDFAGARQVAQAAGIFGDGWTIGMNRDGSPSTRVHAVDGQPKRTFTLEAIPGTMAGAYQEAEQGINVRRHGQSILVQPGVRDYNRMIHADMGLPGTQRERSVKQLQDQRGGLMGAFLNFYEHRQQQIDPSASR